MGIEEVKATIRAGIEAAEEAERVIIAVRDNLGSTRSLAAATTHDSRHETVGRGLGAIDEADHEAELTLRRLRAGATAADRYVGLMG